MTPYYQKHTLLYHDGALVPAAEACIDLYSQSLHYGYSVFEGIRSYKTVNGATRIFKASEHYERLRLSAKAMNMPFSWELQTLIGATYEVLAANQLQDAYIRPLVYAPANMSFSKNTRSHLVIEAWEMKPFLGDQLLKIMTSSFQRPNPSGFRIHAKAGGHYVNSILASQEAKEKGYDEALLNDISGYVAEGPGANVFYEQDGALFTPPPGNILAGITRATVLELCAERDIPVYEQQFRTASLLKADAAFFCGTAAEIIGWESLDGQPFSKPWEETLSSQLQQAYKDRVTEKTIRRPATQLTAANG